MGSFGGRALSAMLVTGAIAACGSSYTGRETDGTTMPEGGLDASRDPDVKPIVDPPVDAAVDAASNLPASCAEAQTKLGLHVDSNVQIDIDGAGPSPSFVVYCRNMATSTPKEYLELKSTLKSGAASSNFSMWGMGGNCNCPPNPKRTFDRVRLQVPALRINTTDVTFSTRDPATVTACETLASANCQADAHMGFGEAASCVANDDTGGSANIDLRGTPFHIDPSATFVGTGFAPGGSATPDVTRKQVNLTGGGACGYFGATQGLLQLALDP